MFQSSPALSSGRYGRHRRDVATTTSFNPRPPFRAGATFAISPHVDGWPVSILARPFERALPGGSPSSGTWKMVSILARPFERALLPEFVPPRPVTVFQSSPALSSGRYLQPADGAGDRIEFQSSPALSSGRYTPGKKYYVRPSWFQSSPALSSGRY